MMLNAHGPCKETVQMQASKLRTLLAHFTGSESYTRHPLARSVLMTEGVMFLADAAGAHWLTDAVASYQHDERVRREEFQVWKLAVDDHTRRAILAMTDGNTERPIITQHVEYTDFPLNEIVLWLVRSGSHWVLMLPSEY